MRLLMKRTILLLGLLYVALGMQAQVDFDRYFEAHTLRFDYAQAGNAHESQFLPVALKKEAFWGGSHTKLIDTFQYGDYMLSVYDSASNTLIYSRGYSTLFREWRGTPEAQSISRTYTENVVMPFPKATIRITLAERNRQNVFETRYETYISPRDPFIDQTTAFNFPTKRLHGTAEPAKALDIVVLPEGYTEAEMEKFEKDAQRFVNYFFEVEPFASHKQDVNFWAVMAPSAESGTDVPHHGVWRNTLLNTHFYTFYSDRYLTTRDMVRVRDVAALAPYDQIYILVNTEKYGGGGIYNYYNLCSSDNKYSREVFTHEFGHAFAALADEYAYDNTPPETMYDLSVEPWQVNLSTLVDFKSKWADLVEKGTPLPTPNEQTDKVGAFEGGGYSLTKIYRPMYDCKMRSNATNSFCPVCYRAVEALLRFYSE